MGTTTIKPKPGMPCWQRALGSVCAACLLFPATIAATPGDIRPPAGRTPTLWLGPTPLAATDVGIGKQLPERQLHGIDGGVHPLFGESEKRGTVVVVRDPECPVSRRYGSRLSSMAKHYIADGFSFVFIYPSDTLNHQQRIKDRQALDIPGIYVDQGSFALAEALGVKSTGDVFVLDETHRLRYRGAIDDQYGLGYTKDFPTRNYLRNALDALANGQPILVPATTAPGCYIDADPSKDPLFQSLPVGDMVS